MCTRAVGGLAHYFEQEGLSTTQISLIREHTEVIRPPRALWVPFELGRPLGVPNDQKFQAGVLSACLKLLEAAAGPVLEDYAEDVPSAARASLEDIEGMVCEIDFPAPPSSDSELAQALLAEISRIRPWYEMALTKGGRTTVGLSRMNLEDGARFLSDFIEDPTLASPFDDLEVSAVLKLVCEDLKAFYGEAMAAQPGMSSGLAVEHWLWNETVLGRTLWRFRDGNTDHPDPKTRYVARRQVVPDRQIQFKGADVFEPNTSL